MYQPFKSKTILNNISKNYFQSVYTAFNCFLLRWVLELEIYISICRLISTLTVVLWISVPRFTSSSFYLCLQHFTSSSFYLCLQHSENRYTYFTFKVNKCKPNWYPNKVYFTSQRVHKVVGCLFGNWLTIDFRGWGIVSHEYI